MPDESPHDPRSDERLTAFLDGELGQVEADAMAAILSSDDALATRLALLARGGLALREAFDPLLDQAPVSILEAVLTTDRDP